MEKTKIKINKNPNTSKFFMALMIVLGLSIGMNFVLIQTNGVKFQKYVDQISHTFIQPVSAQEVNPLFTCPCCGKTIDHCECAMAKERKAFIEGLTQAESLSKEKILLAFAKKYGLDSFKDDKQKQEFREKLIKEAPAERPIISVAPQSYDFGDISQTKGKVNTLFEITNTGKADLIINKLETSCGCTSASIIYQDKEGPIFSMSMPEKENPTNWQIAVPAGKKAYLKVYYDPNVHKKFRGAAVREIYIFSNDPINFETKVKIELNQVD